MLKWWQEIVLALKLLLRDYRAGEWQWMCQQKIRAFRCRIKVLIDLAKVRNDHVADCFRTALRIHNLLDDLGDFVGLIDRRHVGTHRIKLHADSCHLLAIDFRCGNHGVMTAGL